jgi:hypothetical protein
VNFNLPETASITLPELINHTRRGGGKCSKIRLGKRLAECSSPANYRGFLRY